MVAGGQVASKVRQCKDSAFAFGTSYICLQDSAFGEGGEGEESAFALKDSAFALKDSVFAL